MARLSRSLRWTGGLLAALVLAVLSFGPALDALVCNDEPAASASVSTSLEVQSVSDNHPTSEDHGGSAGGAICAHGHCHHSSPYVSPISLSAEVPTVRDRSMLVHEDVAPASAQLNGLKRPPRV